MRPAGSSAAFSNDTAATPTFTPDLPGLYTVRLVVNDGLLDSAPDDVDIRTNGPPIANAGPDQTVPVGSTVQLDGINSSDPENSPLTYSWILNTRPPGSTATLSNSQIRNPTFVADLPGAYLAQLVVNDGLVNSSSDLIVIRTANRAPIANAGADIANVPLNTQVTLMARRHRTPTAMRSPTRGHSCSGRPEVLPRWSTGTRPRLPSRSTSQAATACA